MISRKELLKGYLALGLRRHQQGEIDAAAAQYRQALALAPGNGEALHLLGTAELQLGNAQDAVRHLERAAAVLKKQPGILGNLAQAYFALGRFTDAHEAFRKANRLDPGQLGFQVGMANALAMQGKAAEAEIALRKITERHPREILAWFNLGNVLRGEHRFADALGCYQKTLELDPRFADAHNNLGSALHSLQQFDAAEKAYRACLALDPDHAQARFNLASVTIDAGKFREAEAVCRELVARSPEAAIAHTTLGVSLSLQGRTREALQSHRRAAELAPDDANAAEALATVLGNVGETDAALREFARALSLDSGLHTVRGSRGGTLLAAGRLAEGWRDYSHRAQRANGCERYPGIPLTRVLTDKLQGSSLLLLGDQGLGDELFFLRFAPALHAAGARLTYWSDAKIVSLLERVDCLDTVISGSATLPQADAAMLISDLPYALNEYAARQRDTASIAAPTHWPVTPVPLVLTPDPARLDAMRQRLCAAGDAPYLGISWQGGVAPKDQGGSGWTLFKTIDPGELARALRTFPGTVIALQRHPRAQDIECFSRMLGRALSDFSALNEDLEDMLALLALIDEYVGVSNTNMHLRAGLNKGARVLVPQPAEWRWMVSGNHSPWFPGFSIYRQSDEGDWQEAMAALTRDLGSCLALDRS